MFLPRESTGSDGYCLNDVFFGLTRYGHLGQITLETTIGGGVSAKRAGALSRPGNRFGLASFRRQERSCRVTV